MPGAMTSGFSEQYRKDNPGVTETSRSLELPQRKSVIHRMGKSMGKRAAQQIADPTRTDIPGTRIVSVTPAKAGKTPLVNTAPKGRVPSGKRARKHNVRRG